MVRSRFGLPFCAMEKNGSRIKYTENDFVSDRVGGREENSDPFVCVYSGSDFHSVPWKRMDRKSQSVPDDAERFSRPKRTSKLKYSNTVRYSI